MKAFTNTNIDQVPAPLEDLVPIQAGDDDLLGVVVRDEESRRTALEVLVGIVPFEAPLPIKFQTPSSYKKWPTTKTMSLRASSISMGVLAKMGREERGPSAITEPTTRALSMSRLSTTLPFSRWSAT